VSQLENELKYELDEPSYQRLLERLAPLGKPLVFRNIYFACSLDSGRRDWVLRLRRGSSDPGELTLKIGGEVSPGTFRSIEYTAAVLGVDPTRWEDTEPLRVLRSEVSRSPLVLQGEAHNERWLLAAPLGPVPRWELDRTTLPGGKTCYELEIEYPAGSSPTVQEVGAFRGQLQDWLAAQGVSAGASRKTKYRRFLEATGAV
jgi:hypothetical protein